MKTNFNKKEFYKELGNLLYAIAMADKKIRPQEIDAVNDFIKKELTSLEKDIDSSGMNLAYYSYFQFETADDEFMEIEEAKKSFIKFIDNNILSIDSNLIEKSLDAIDCVAMAYKKINKKEKAFIDQVKKEINEVTDLF